VRCKLVSSLALVLATLVACRVPSPEDQTKPNVVAIRGDDSGLWNLSTYNQRMMGYATPNLLCKWNL
jgi:arylsulfatase